MGNALASIHRMLQQGKVADARVALGRLISAKVPRRHVLTFARFAIRVGAPEWGIRLLNPIVRPPVAARIPATPAERSEYGYLLIKHGALDEGEKIVEEIDPREEPRALFYRASARIARWDYAGSIALLREYLASTRLDAYARLVGQVNLAAALVYEREASADALLRELLYASSLRGHELMLGRVLELSAENFMLRGNLGQAKKFLAEAARRLRGSRGIDDLFVRKYSAICSLLECDDEKSRAALAMVRDEASARGHWETLRNCDRLEAVATRDESLLRFVYFGTPYRHYRERLLRDFGAIELSQSYAWTPGAKQARGPALDLETGKLGTGLEIVERGSLPHRLLSALSSDFYRPLRIGAVFARLYPERFFHPKHSPPLVHDGIARLRTRFKDRNFLLDIVEEAGFYRLAARGDVSVLTPQEQEPAKRYGDELKRLRAYWPREPFSIGQAIELLELPRRTLFRVLANAVEDGMLEKKGARAATRYCFAHDEKPSKG